MTSSRRASLLVVLAHPDDEIFHGGMLMHSSQQGVRVTLAVPPTARPASRIRPSERSTTSARLRIEELKLSCRQARHRPACAPGFPRLRAW